MISAGVLVPVKLHAIGPTTITISAAGVRFPFEIPYAVEGEASLWQHEILVAHFAAERGGLKEWHFSYGEISDALLPKMRCIPYYICKAGINYTRISPLVCFCTFRRELYNEAMDGDDDGVPTWVFPLFEDDPGIIPASVQHVSLRTLLAWGFLEPGCRLTSEHAATEGVLESSGRIRVDGRWTSDTVAAPKEFLQMNSYNAYKFVAWRKVTVTLHGKIFTLHKLKEMLVEDEMVKPWDREDADDDDDDDDDDEEEDEEDEEEGEEGEDIDGGSTETEDQDAPPPSKKKNVPLRDRDQITFRDLMHANLMTEGDIIFLGKNVEAGYGLLTSEAEIRIPKDGTKIKCSSDAPKHFRMHIAPGWHQNQPSWRDVYVQRREEGGVRQLKELKNAYDIKGKVSKLPPPLKFSNTPTLINNNPNNSVASGSGTIRKRQQVAPTTAPVEPTPKRIRHEDAVGVNKEPSARSLLTDMQGIVMQFEQGLDAKDAEIARLNKEVTHLKEELVSLKKIDPLKEQFLKSFGELDALKKEFEKFT